MPVRLSIAAAAAVLTAVPLLTSCGGGTPQAGSSSATTEAPVSASTAPTAAAPSATPSSTPTSNPAQDKKDVVAVSEKFSKTFLTLGYPDKSLADYLDRLRPLTTDAGYAEVKKEASKDDFEKTLKRLTSAHARSVSNHQDEVKVVTLTSDSAVTKVRFSAKFQRQSGGGWKTVSTSPTESGTIDLKKQDGTWLVDHLPS